ncbi:MULTISPECIES: hypothetical protein [Cyanophyceae]|uniref:hypothetical protein n=1 Tax=Cyanophyceae TaxID=3028117 RepID=UPI001683F5D0|nr:MULTISPECIES: hypothetical protein [Cyanophyceae]MBD1914737.1 hypothetical protein [Phormidium sp. FACHB-77]MBD2030840.1 hypothetical protein [Phormidium sp. FACHB-322]MBD2052439.1 hypothetical protein [Leptolyngbya sp. FACHB-60]
MPQSKHTQAHLSRTVPKDQSEFFKKRTRDSMEYYMGAKLLEVGINPKNTVYRWKSEIKGSQEEITISAYWGDSREKLEAEENA